MNKKVTKKVINNKKTGKKTTPVLMAQQQFSGPIPPPDMLERYNQIIPNAAERILIMAEKNSDALIEREREELRIIKRGQNYALIVILSLFIVCIIALFLHEPVVASALASIGIGGVIVAFVYDRKSKSPIKKS